MKDSFYQACAPPPVWLCLLLNHHSHIAFCLCLLQMCPLWCSFDYHALWMSWASSSGSGSSCHTLLQKKEMEPKTKRWDESCDGDFEFQIVTVVFFFFYSLSKQWQTSLIIIHFSMSIPTTDYKASHLKCVSRDGCQLCSAGTGKQLWCQVDTTD